MSAESNDPSLLIALSSEAISGNVRPVWPAAQHHRAPPSAIKLWCSASRASPRQHTDYRRARTQGQDFMDLLISTASSGPLFSTVSMWR